MDYIQLKEGVSMWQAIAAAVQVGGGLFAGYQGAKSSRSMAQYQADIYDTNSRLANMQAEDAIRRGDEEASRMLRQTRQAIGSQRAAMAASGIEIGYGTAKDIEVDTAVIGAENAQIIKNNAWREAWGYKVEGVNQSRQASLTRMGGANQAQAQILGSVLSGMDKGVDSYTDTKGFGTGFGFGGKK